MPKLEMTLNFFSRADSSTRVLLSRGRLLSTRSLSTSHEIPSESSILVIVTPTPPEQPAESPPADSQAAPASGGETVAPYVPVTPPVSTRYYVGKGATGANPPSVAHDAPEA